MSLKIHFLHSHLEIFPDNLGDVKDEHCERSHHDISDIEIRCKGKPNDKMVDNGIAGTCREKATPYIDAKQEAKNIFKVYSCTLGYAIHWLFYNTLQRCKLTTCIGGMKVL